MLIFKCVFSHNELKALENYLPPEQYCIISKGTENLYYGIIADELHSRMMDILSGESLGCLEYLDEAEFRNFIAGLKGDEVITGNRNLIESRN